MALYVIDAVRLDTNGEVEAVRWARANGMTNQFEERIHEVDIDRVVQALDHHDVVQLRFKTPNGYVSGGATIRKILPGGRETIQETRSSEPGRTIRDLPRF